MENTKAFILASGLAERLRPLTENTNKGMLLVAGKPVLEHIVENILQHGVKDVVFGVGHLKEQVMDYFGDGSRYGNDVHMEYSISNSEDMPNTAGQIALARPQLEVAEHVLIHYGDALTNLDITRFFETHKEGSKAITSPGTKQINTESGIYLIDEAGTVIDFREKADVRKMARDAFFKILEAEGHYLPSIEYSGEVPENGVTNIGPETAVVRTGNGKVYEIAVEKLIDMCIMQRMYSNVPIYWVTKDIWQSDMMAIGKDFNAHVVEQFREKGQVKLYLQKGPELWHLDIGDIKKYKITCHAYETKTQAEVGKLA